MSNDWTGSEADDDVVEGEAPRAGTREGLPPSYRMRADPHYVEQLAAAPTHPVIHIGAAQLESHGSARSADLRSLVDSIRAHGIVHPVLVRRRYAKYAVIAGHKRVAAAVALRLPTVPCIVHEATDAEAAALERADNLSVHEVVAPRSAPADSHGHHAAIDQHVRTIRRCAGLSLEGVAASHRSMLRVVQAHAWRLECVHRAILFGAGQWPRSRRRRSIAAIVDEVIEGFAPEAGLAGITIDAEIGDLPSMSVDDTELTIGLAGALLAVLPLVDSVDRARIVIKAAKAAPGSVAIEIAQVDAVVPPAVAAHFLSDDLGAARPGGHDAEIGIRAARGLAERHGGQAAFELLHPGCRLTIRLARPV